MGQEEGRRIHWGNRQTVPYGKQGLGGSRQQTTGAGGMHAARGRFAKTWAQQPHRLQHTSRRLPQLGCSSSGCRLAASSATSSMAALALPGQPMQRQQQQRVPGPSSAGVQQQRLQLGRQFRHKLVMLRRADRAPRLALL